jgi:hypothetical protein
VFCRMIRWMALSNDRIPTGAVGWVHFCENVPTVPFSRLRVVWVVLPPLEVRPCFGIVIRLEFVGDLHVANLGRCIGHVDQIGQVDGKRVRLVAAHGDNDDIAERCDGTGFLSIAVDGPDFHAAADAHSTGLAPGVDSPRRLENPEMRRVAEHLERTSGRINRQGYLSEQGNEAEADQTEFLQLRPSIDER